MIEELALTPPPFAISLLEIADCLCDELETHGAGPVCWCGVMAGNEPAWDHCTECANDVCGMGYIRLTGIAPFATFPQQDITFGCDKPLMYTVEVGALRCLPYPDDGEPPVPTVMAEVALRQWVDAMAMYRALRCCDQRLLSVQQYFPLGPQGGCVGGLWLATIGIY